MRLTEVVVIFVAIKPTTTVGAGEEAKETVGEGLNTRTHRFIYLYDCKLFAHNDSRCEEEDLTKEMVTPLLLPLPYMYMRTTFE